LFTANTATKKGNEFINEMPWRHCIKDLPADTCALRMLVTSDTKSAPVSLINETPEQIYCLW